MKFTLLPLWSRTHPNVSNEDRRTIFMITYSKQQMGAAIKESRVVHALVVKQVLTMGEKQKSVEHIAEVKMILEEFHGVMPEELSDGLPLMKDIQHI